MNRPFLLHHHFVAMTRERLGERADVLLSDAARLHEGSIWRLSESMDVRLVMRDTEGGATEADAYQRRKGARWHGDALHLDRFLPAVVQTRMTGMRMGDVIACTGADDRVVRHVNDGNHGNTITIETTRLDARAIPLARRLAAAGPARRMLNGMAYEWHQAANAHRERPRTWIDAAGDACFVIVMTGALILAVTTFAPGSAAAATATIPVAGYIVWKTALTIRTMIGDQAARRAVAGT